VRQELGLPGGFVKFFIEPIKDLDTFSLTIEGFDDDMTTVHLFHMPVDMPQVFLLCSEIFLRMLDNDADHEHRHRDGQQGDQRHGDIDRQHHDQDANDRSHRADDLRQALVQCLADRIHVVSHT